MRQSFFEWIASQPAVSLDQALWDQIALLRTEGSAEARLAEVLITESRLEPDEWSHIYETLMLTSGSRLIGALVPWAQSRDVYISGPTCDPSLAHLGTFATVVARSAFEQGLWEQMPTQSLSSIEQFTDWLLSHRWALALDSLEALKENHDLLAGRRLPLLLKRYSVWATFDLRGHDPLGGVPLHDVREVLGLADEISGARCLLLTYRTPDSVDVRFPRLPDTLAAGMNPYFRPSGPSRYSGETEPPAASGLMGRPEAIHCPVPLRSLSRPAVQFTC